MNEHKVCFIICSNKETELAEALFYIDRLRIPAEMEIEIIAINAATCLAGAYNDAMKSTDARYKVYLHQDVYVINVDMISNFLVLFQQHPEIGLIGMAGAKRMPATGCWFETGYKEQVGSLIENSMGKMRVIRSIDREKLFEEVEVIDGLIMITQYDLPWREDLFDGWHFYDASASYEYRRRGYKVVIPGQKEPWCIHRSVANNVDLIYEHYREIFVREYLEMGSEVSSNG